jgi:hypothetical protein
MVYSPDPPYEVLQTSNLDFPTVQRLRRFSQLWDRVANSGHFRTTVARLWQSGSPFHNFLEFTDWFTPRMGRTHGIALKRLADEIFTFLVVERGLDPAEIGPELLADYRRGGRRDLPGTLKPYDAQVDVPPADGTDLDSQRATPPRQARHL